MQWDLNRLREIALDQANESTPMPRQRNKPALPSNMSKALETLSIYTDDKPEKPMAQSVQARKMRRNTRNQLELAQSILLAIQNNPEILFCYSSLATYLDRPRTTVKDNLDYLIANGLVSRRSVNLGYYSAVSDQASVTNSDFDPSILQTLRNRP